jgi:hypothetical protein
MANYTITHSNFTKQYTHLITNDGTIFEQDFVTFADNNILSNNNTILSEGNFAFTIINQANQKKQYNLSTWVAPPTNTDSYNDDFWRLSDVIPVNQTTNLAATLQVNANADIIINTDYTNLASFGYFGSIYELVRTSISDIINNFPGSIYISSNFSNNYPFQYGVENQFFIDLSNKTLMASSTLDDMFNSFFEYEIITCQSEIIMPCSSGLTSSYTTIVLNEDTAESLSSSGFTQFFTEICGLDLLSQVIFTGINGSTITLNYHYATLNGNLTTNLQEITAVISLKDSNGNPIIPFNGLHIRPKIAYINNFFNNLNDLEKILLNKYSNPLYTSIFSIPEEDENGIQNVLTKFTWGIPDGWNIDITSTAYAQYIDALTSAASVLDSYSTDNLYRMLTHDAIKNLDLTSQITDNFDSPEDYILGMTHMEKLIRIYGREFDEIKKYANGISFINTVTYDGKSNLPDVLLKNMIDYGGIKPTSIIYTDNYTDINNELITTNILYSGYNSGYNAYQTENIFYNRLFINLPYILRCKGTKRSIEMIMNLFGVPRSLWDLKEYVYVASNPFSLTDVANISQLNTTTSYTKSGTEYNLNILTISQIENINDIANADDLHDLCIERDNDGTGVPAFKGNSPNLYYQQGGGWYRETVTYINLVTNITDLYNINKAILYPCITYYVTNILNTNVSNYFILQDITNYRNINGWYNVPINEFDSTIITYINDDNIEQQYNISINALISIIEDKTGNNPHVGYGQYDRGLDYIFHFGTTDDFSNPPSAGLFKYTIDNSPLCMQTSNLSQYTDLFNYKFILNRYVDNKKSWSQTNKILNIDPTYNISSKTILGQRLIDGVETNVPYLSCNTSSITDNNFNTRKVDSVNVNNYKLVINTKNVDLVITEENDNFSKEFFDIIMPYIEQVIPSTVIFNVLLSYNYNWVADFSDFYCSGLNDGYVYAALLKKVSISNPNINLDRNNNDINISGLRQAIMLDTIIQTNPNSNFYEVVGTFIHSDYTILTEQFNPEICGITGSITIDRMLTYIYNNTSDTQDIAMYSANNWILYNNPIITTVSPISGTTVSTQLVCTRTGWGNDIISLQNTRTEEIVTCKVQALYLEATPSSVNLLNIGGTQDINVIIYGGDIIDYSISLSGSTNFTIVKNSVNSLTLSTIPNITTNIISGTLILTHLSNSLLTKTLSISQNAGVISYSDIWTNYACEQVSGTTVSYSYSFKNYVCVQQLQLITSYNYNFKNYVCAQVEQVILNNLISISNDGLDAITLTPQYSTPLRSTLTIGVLIRMSDGTHQNIVITMNPNDLNSYGFANTNGDTIRISSAIIVGITPSSDSNYNYTF